MLMSALPIRLQVMIYFEKRIKYFFRERCRVITPLIRIRPPISGVFKRLNRPAIILFAMMFLMNILYSGFYAYKSTAPVMFQSVDSSNSEKLHFLIPVFLQKTIALGRTSQHLKSDLMPLEVRPRAS